MDPDLVAIIEDYLRAHGMNTPPPEVMSDLVAGVGSTIDDLLAALGLAANLGDPADNADAGVDLAERDAGLLDAETKFPANEAESAQMMQMLPQTAAGLAGSISGAIGGVLQGLSQLPQQAAQGAQQALQAGLGALQQSGVGLTDDPMDIDPGEELLDDASWDGTGEFGTGGGGGGDLGAATPAEFEGTNPTGYLGPPAIPPAATAPAAAQPTPTAPPAPATSPSATRGGYSPMPLMAPGGMYGNGTAGETKPETRRVVAPAVKNGAPVQGRITVPPTVTKRLDRPVTTRHVMAPAPTPARPDDTPDES